MTLFDAHVSVGRGLHFQLEPIDLLRQMDRNGIDKAFISPVDRCLAVANEEGNNYILELTRTYPDRFCGYASVNPWYGEEGYKLLRHALNQGLHGIKLHPVLQGFMLFDEIVKPILQLAEEYSSLVYIHTGASMNALPLQVAEVARQFPDVNFIMGRMGKTDYAMDVIPAMEQAFNVYAETAYNYPKYLGNLIKVFGAERVLFSTDMPLTFMDQEIIKFNDIPLSERERKLIGRENLFRLMS